MKKFILPDTTDNRIIYASEYLQGKGFILVDKAEKADFTLLGVNPSDFNKYAFMPVYAGNVCSNNVFDYTKRDDFALENAYLSAEGAISLAISQSDKTLINSNVLILGYGKIARALHKYLYSFTPHITICARNKNQKTLAKYNLANVISFSSLKEKNDYDFVFNTVPHPVINKEELEALKDDVLMLDLASFPGGIDAHFSKALNKKLVVARGIPARYSPKSAGYIVGKAVEKMIIEGE